MRTIRIFALVCALTLAVLSAFTPQFALSQTYSLLPVARQQFLTATGGVLANGTLEFYNCGSTTPKAPYSDSSGTALPTTVQLNSAGRPQTAGGVETGVYLAQSCYKIIAKNAGGVTQWTQDNVSDIGAILKLDIAASFVTKNLDTTRYASQFASIRAAYADLPSTGGTVMVAAGARTETLNIVLTAGKPLKLKCAGSNSTIISYNGSGFFIDTASGTSVVSYVSVEDCGFSIGATATGLIRTGTTGTAYAAGNFRNEWNLKNIHADGGDPAVAGRIGLSLTQVAEKHIQNVTIVNFEQCAKFDRGTVNVLIRFRCQSFKYGLEFTKNPATSPGLVGHDGTQCYGCDILGPTEGSTASPGWGLRIDHENVQFYGGFWEQASPNNLSGVNASRGIVITSLGTFAKFYGTFLSGGTDPNLKYVAELEAGFCSPLFSGMQIRETGTWAPFKINAVGVGQIGCKAMFIGGSTQLAVLVKANSTADYHWMGGSDNSEYFDITTDRLDVRALLRVEQRTTACPTHVSRKGLEFCFDNVTNYATITSADRDTAPDDAKQILYNASGHIFQVAATTPALAEAFRVDTNGVRIGTGGTAVTQMKVYAADLSGGSAPAATPANDCVEQTFAVTGVSGADVIQGFNPPSSVAGVGPVSIRVSAADQIAINFCNPTAAPVTPPPGLYKFTTVR